MFRFLLTTISCLQQTKTLIKLNCKCTKKNQYAPHKWTMPIYGKNKQFATPADKSPTLYKHGVKLHTTSCGIVPILWTSSCQYIPHRHQ